MVLWTVWAECKARGEFRSSVGMELVGSVFRSACGAHCAVRVACQCAWCGSMHAHRLQGPGVRLMDGL